LVWEIFNKSIINDLWFKVGNNVSSDEF
jgi:hypothetical protein